MDESLPVPGTTTKRLAFGRWFFVFVYSAGLVSAGAFGGWFLAKPARPAKQNAQGLCRHQTSPARQRGGNPDAPFGAVRSDPQSAHSPGDPCSPGAVEVGSHPATGQPGGVVGSQPGDRLPRRHQPDACQPDWPRDPGTAARCPGDSRNLSPGGGGCRAQPAGGEAHCHREAVQRTGADLRKVLLEQIARLAKEFGKNPGEEPIEVRVLREAMDRDQKSLQQLHDHCHELKLRCQQGNDGPTLFQSAQASFEEAQG